MKHLSENELSAWIDDALEPHARRDAEHHLAACAECREALAELEAQDHALARLLERDPGEAYFERFAERVAARIREEGRNPAAVAEAHVLAGHGDGEAAPEPAPATERRLRQAAPPAGSLLEIIGRWLSGPRLAWVGATAAVVAAGGVVFLISREGALHTFQDRNISVRGHQVEGAAPPSATAPSAPSAGATESTAPPSTGPVANDESARETRPSELREQSPAAGAPSPTAIGPSSSTLARRETGVAAPGVTTARSRPVERKGGEDVPVAGAVPPAPAPATEAQSATPAPANRLAKIKQSQQQGVAPMQSAPQSARDQSALAEQVRLCGTVRDAEGRPVANAQVGFTDASTGVSTDANGHWCLETSPGERTLSIMAVGFRESRRNLEVTGGSEGQDVTLAAVPVLDNRGGSSLLGMVGRSGPGSWPASVASFAADAQRAMDAGVKKGSATEFDRAARSWERVANAVRSGPVGVSARRNLAEARYLAWQAGRNQARSIAAISAMSSYLAVAPPEEREVVQRRLNEVSRH